MALGPRPSAGAQLCAEPGSGSPAAGGLQTPTGGGSRDCAGLVSTAPRDLPEGRPTLWVPQVLAPTSSERPPVGWSRSEAGPRCCVSQAPEAQEPPFVKAL